MRELIIPPEAVSDPDSVEIIRAWVGNGAQWVSLFPNFYKNEDYDEEWAWGVFLADTIQHLANAIAEDSNKRAIDVLEKIRRSLTAELDDPSRTIRGGYVKYGSA